MDARQGRVEGGPVRRVASQAIGREVVRLTHYVIRVAGHLSDDLLTAFPLLLAENRRPETVLHGQLPDQSALAGVLAHLDELGVEIVDVSLVPDLPVAHGAGRAGRS